MTRTPTATTPTPQRHWSWPWGSSLIALVALAGLVIFQYPTIAAWYSQLDQSRVIAQSVRGDAQDSAAEARELQLAHRYNDELESGARVVPNERIPSGVAKDPGGRQSLRYEKLLNTPGTGVMARVRIPSIDVDQPLYHGTSDATLLRGLGHLEGTSLPVGGAGTHSVITGHRGLAEATMFTDLDKVKVGDTFTIEVFGEVLTYRVQKTEVVDPDQTESLVAVPGKDLMTLVTCTPLGINTQRILVTGERVLPTPASDVEQAGKAPTLPHFPWWAVVLGGGAVVAGVYVWWSGRPARGPGRRRMTSTENNARNS